MPSSAPSRVDVCMLVRNFYEHDGRVEKEAECLAARGLRVMVLAQWKPGLAPYERILNHEVLRLPLDRWDTTSQDTFWARVFNNVSDLMTTYRPWMPGISRLQRTMHTLSYQVRAISAVVRNRPDTVHSHDLDTLLPGAISAAITQAKLVYDSHELWVERHINLGPLARWIHRTKYSFLESALIHRADTVFTVCNSIADELASRYDIERPTVLRNVPTFSSPTPRDLHRELSIDGPILLYVGTIAPHRGIERAVRALRFLPEQIHLVVVGPKRGTTAEEVAAVAMEIKVDKRLTILDPVAPGDIIALAGGADVGLCLHQRVCLSYEYVLPNKLFEYGFAGLPVVASNLPEVRQVVQKHHLGTLCDPDNPRDIAKAVKTILNGTVPIANGDERQKFINEFDWSHEKEKMGVAYPRKYPTR